MASRIVTAVKHAIPRRTVVVQNVVYVNAPPSLPTADQLQRMQRETEYLGG